MVLLPSSCSSLLTPKFYRPFFILFFSMVVLTKSEQRQRHIDIENEKLTLGHGYGMTSLEGRRAALR